MIAPDRPRDEDVDLRHDVRRDTTHLRDESGLDVAVRIRRADNGPTATDRQLGQLRPIRAVIVHGLARVDSALHRQTGAGAGADVDEHAVVALILVAEVPGIGDVVASRSRKPRRRDVVKTGHHVPSAAGQTGIHRHCDAERRDVADVERLVVGRREVLEPSAEVTDFH